MNRKKRNGKCESKKYSISKIKKYFWHVQKENEI